MSRPKAFIIQEIMKRDERTGEMTPQMDFRSVLEYGDPVILLTSGRIGFSPGPTIDTLREKLRNITPDDWIVTAGDPTAIFITAMIAADYLNGKVNLLKWDKNHKQYIKVTLDIHYRARAARDKEN